MTNTNKGFKAKVDNFFGISKMGSNFKTEIVAGLTTFMTMVYILMVNSGMFQSVIGGTNPYGAAYIATAIGAIVGTLLMAFLAKMPLAQASGMGINAFIVYTLCLGSGLSYANTMLFVLIDGVIFLLLTATGLRKQIFEAIPAGVRHAIPVGIGLFIAFIGFQSAGANLIVDDASTLTALVSFNILAEGYNFANVIAPITGIAGVIAIAVLSKKNVKGSVLWGILGSTALYYILHAICLLDNNTVSQAVFNSISIANPFDAFKAWGNDAVAKVFTEGFNFDGYLNAGNSTGSLVLVLITSALSLCMIDMFDTIGTLYGACARGNLLDENGTPINMDKSMLADSIATCVGAVVGTSTVTTFVESSSGVAAGGKTGFTALVTAICFAVAMFFSPIAQLIPGAATASALIWVGILMMNSVTKIDWNDAADSIVAFATFITMLLGYSINKGIGAGILVYVIIKICTGKIKEISIPTWVIGALFVATFLLT